MPIIFLVVFLIVGCGKVANDIDTEQSKSSFNSATFSFNFSDQNGGQWVSLASTENVSSVYGYLAGISYDRGLEKAGWATAEVEYKQVASKNISTVINFDEKRNVVSSSRYMQGLINFDLQSTGNYQTKTTFRKVRNKFDFYSFSHYISKDTYQFKLVEALPTAAIQLTPHDHLISAIYLTHLKQESYNQSTIIPLSVFYRVIPAAAITPTLNIMPQNKVRRFNYEDPVFTYDSPLFDALLATVSLVYYSDEYDALEYIKSKDDATFSTDMKSVLMASVATYFESNSKGGVDVDNDGVSGNVEMTTSP